MGVISPTPIGPQEFILDNIWGHFGVFTGAPGGFTVPLSELLGALWLFVGSILGYSGTDLVILGSNGEPFGLFVVWTDAGGLFSVRLGRSAAGSPMLSARRIEEAAGFLGWLASAVEAAGASGLGEKDLSEGHEDCRQAALVGIQGLALTERLPSV